MLASPFTAAAENVGGLVQSVRRGDLSKLGRRVDLNQPPVAYLTPEQKDRMVDLVTNAVTPAGAMTKALHGSAPGKPVFDKFSKEFIGSGEGGAARGWGIYATDVPDVANTYRRLDSADPGNLYHLTLHPNKQKENWLEWDMPVPKEQIQAIQRQFQKEGLPVPVFSNTSTGGNTYHHIASELAGKSPEWQGGATKRAASEFLDRAGIDGIRFEAGSIMGPNPGVVAKKVEGLTVAQLKQVLDKSAFRPPTGWPDDINQLKQIALQVNNAPAVNDTLVKMGLTTPDYNYVIFNPDHIRIDAVEEFAKAVKDKGSK